MPVVDLADDSFIRAAPAVVRREMSSDFWRSCWPDLAFELYHDRGDEGARWYVSGALTGVAEVWLEPYRDATLVHVYLRGDPERPLRSRRRAVRLTRRYALALKRAGFELKDRLEAAADARG